MISIGTQTFKKIQIILHLNTFYVSTITHSFVYFKGETSETMLKSNLMSLKRATQFYSGQYFFVKIQ